MSLTINVVYEQSKGVDMIGDILVYIEEKNDEKEAIKCINQLRSYYNPNALFILLLRRISNQESFLRLRSLLDKIFSNGYIIAIRESVYIAKIVHTSLDGTTIFFKY